MNGVKLSTLLLVFLLNGCVLLALSASESDNSLNDLYESLLQREYTGPISFPNHQVERKAQRSPSLRLRFGRRSDPGLSYVDKTFSEEINKKPIRSPSLRLRFGKRDSQMQMPMFGEDYFSNEVELRREPRVPSTRLRWGRRSDPDSVPINADDLIYDQFDVQPEKRKQVRLRYGRSYKSGADEQTETQNLRSFINSNNQEQNDAANPSSDIYFNRLGF